MTFFTLIGTWLGVAYCFFNYCFNCLQTEALRDSEDTTVSREAVVSTSSTQPAYESTLKELLSDKFSACISTNTCVSRNEIIYNILNMCEAHKVNNTVFISMFKLVNSMFGEPIVPDTHYKLDQLLFSVCGLKYHFYCSKLSCKKLLKVKDVTLPISCKCGQVNFVSDLTKASYFVTFDICTQLEMLLRDPDIACLLLDMKSYHRASASVHDLYDGEVYQKLISSLDFNDGAKHLSTVTCVDATPMYKSSNCEIVPMQATLNEFPPLLRMKKTILLGLWFGSDKPNYNSFFKPVIRSLNKLSEEGATIDIGGVQTFVKIHNIGCCVDSGVRGAIQGVHQHNGICGCNWCLHPGVLEGGGSTARKYPFLEAPPLRRTHAQVQRDADVVKTLPRSTAPSAPRPHVNGVVESTPLLTLRSLDVVEGLVVDTMHNVFLGVLRQFLRLWSGLEGNLKLPDNSLPGYYIGSPSILSKINRRIALLVPPLEVRRLPRPLSDLLHYKARELENFLLYFFFPVMRGILPDKYLKHFVLYVQGMYLLMKDEILPEDFPAASFLLKKFVKEIHDIYLNPNFSEDKQNTFNVHLTLHAVDNAKRWGPGWSVSAFPYENGNGDLADSIAANRGIPDQVSRALCKRNLRNLLSQEIDSANCASFLNDISSRQSSSITYIGNVKVFGLTPQEFQPNPEESFLLHQSSLNANDFCVAKKFVFNNCVFGPRLKNLKHRNDFVKLTTGDIVQVKKVIASETLDTILIFYSIVHVRAYNVQVDAHLTISTPFIYDVILIEHEQHLGNHLTFCKPCVYSNLRSEGGKETISVMAHVINVT